MVGMTPLDPALWSAKDRAVFESRRRSRNRALGLILGALVILFFGITVVRMISPEAQLNAIAASEQPGWNGR